MRELQQIIDNYINRIVDTKKIYSYITFAEDVKYLLCDKVSYLDDGLYCRHTVEGALIDGKAVCDGIAKAYKMILNRFGIPCEIATGQIKDPQNMEMINHAWNKVNVNGYWFDVDLTKNMQEK